MLYWKVEWTGPDTLIATHHKTQDVFEGTKEAFLTYLQTFEYNPIEDVITLDDISAMIAAATPSLVPPLALVDGAIDASAYREYTELSYPLAPVDGLLTIPLDGKVYSVSGEVTSVVAVPPDLPLVGTAVVYVPDAIPIPSEWQRPEGFLIDGQTELLINSEPSGAITVRASNYVSA
jgi:hypothetical protein